MNEDHDQPRLTIRTMVDYLTATGAHQRFNILQNMRNQLGRRHFAPYYRDARNAIRRFHAGNGNALEHEIQRLLRQRRDAHSNVELAKIDNNVRVLSDHRDNFSEERMAHVPQQFQPLLISGVRISTEPTLSGTIARRKSVIDCNIIIDTQSDEPGDDEVDYALEMLHRGSGQSHAAPVAGAQYWHPSSGQSWLLNRASARRWRDIQHAAAEIAARWPTIR